MDKRILIVHSDSEMINIIRDILDERRQALRLGKGYELVIRRARTQPAALDLANDESIDLVITGLDIASDGELMGPAGEHGKGGQELIRKLRQITKGTAAVLITGHIDDDIYDFTMQEGVALVKEGQNFATELAEKIEQSLGDAESRESFYDLEISLKPDKGGCFYQFLREGQTAIGPRTLDVNPQILGELVEKSREIHLGDKSWKRELREVGDSLADELFSRRTPNNATFLKEFHTVKGMAGGIKNIRIRFVVEETFHPLAFEAFKEKEEQEFFMLLTPIYRRLERPIESLDLDLRGLFQDDETRTGPINILVINANVPSDTILVDKARDLDLQIQHLKILGDEVEAIEKLFLDLKQKGRRIGEVRVIDETCIASNRTFAQEVQQSLENGNWHIVHYGGHTYFDDKNEIGYLFFPGRGLESVQAIEIDMFSLWLRSSTRFVFLSSCTSAEHTFMFHLAEQGVPAIMGFLWKVEDPMAREFAETFYTHLFSDKNQSLEYASLMAKVEMNKKHKNNPIWAAPVLVVMEAGPRVPRFAA